MAASTEAEKHIEEVQENIFNAITHLSSVVDYKADGYDGYAPKNFDKLRLALTGLINIYTWTPWGTGN